VLKISDGRNFGRTFTGICLVLAPLLFLLGQIVGPNVDDDNKLKELANAAAHKNAYYLGNLLFLLGGLVLIFAAIGVIHMFRGRKLGLGQVAGGLLVIAGAVNFSWYAFGMAEYEMVNHSGLDRAALATFLDKADGSSSIVPLIILFALGTVLGLLLLGIAAWRRRIVPIWAAILISIAGIFSFFAQSKGAGIVEFVILLVALGSLARAAFRMSDEEWDSRDTAPPADRAPAPSAA
jgi:hypothetical protein